MWPTFYTRLTPASSFKAIQIDIPIYTSIVEAQVEIEIQPPIAIQSIVVS